LFGIAAKQADEHVSRTRVLQFAGLQSDSSALTHREAFVAWSEGGVMPQVADGATSWHSSPPLTPGLLSQVNDDHRKQAKNLFSGYD